MIKRNIVSISLIVIIISLSLNLFLFKDGRFLSQNAISKQSNIPKQNQMVVPTAITGLENIKSNIIRNGGFEEESSYHGALYYSHYGTANVYVNSSYQDEAYGGSYSGILSAKGTNQFSTEATNYHYLTSHPQYAYLDQIQYLDLWYNCKSNPDLSNGAIIFFYVAIASNSGEYLLHYYLSSSSIPNNDSHSTYFDVRGSLGSWLNIYRNITADFESAHGGIDYSMYITFIYFRLYSPMNPTDFTTLIIDEVSVENSTFYEYVLEQNGDFEDGDGNYWANYKRGPGSAYLIDNDKTEGKKSLNLTASSTMQGSLGQISCDRNIYVDWYNYPKSYYVTAPNDFIIKYDWKYSDTLDGGTVQYAYFYMYFTNATYSATFVYLLGDISDAMHSGFSNETSGSSMIRYYLANGFGTRDEWRHFEIDLYTYYLEEHLTTLVPYLVAFFVTAGMNANCKVQLLLDDFQVVTYPTGDPSFEQDWDWNQYDPLISWNCNHDHSYVNITSDAHSGNHAANITGNNVPFELYVSRSMYLPVQNNLFTNFWWKLNEISSGSTTYSYVNLRFGVSKNIYYVLGSGLGTYFTNNSENCYYYVDNFNQTCIWYNLVRNVANDTIAAFGTNTWNITAIRFCCGATGSGAKVSLLIDDIHFGSDITPPTISNFMQYPTYPNYNYDVVITMDVVDNVQVKSVEMYYKLGTASWTTTPLYQSGIYYFGWIPAAAYGTTVYYYIVATDIYDNIRNLGNLTSPLSYFVYDFTDPVLFVDGPVTTVPLQGDVEFLLTGTDEGSGIKSFRIIVGDVTLYEDVTVPANYTWHTNDFTNGEYTIIFILQDNALYDTQVSLTYTIQNVTSKSGLAISLELSILSLIVISLFIIKKKARK